LVHLEVKGQQLMSLTGVLSQEFLWVQKQTKFMMDWKRDDKFEGNSHYTDNDAGRDHFRSVTEQHLDLH